MFVATFLWATKQEFLARYDLPVYLAMPLQRTYGDGAIQALRDIPTSG